MLLSYTEGEFLMFSLLTEISILNTYQYVGHTKIHICCTVVRKLNTRSFKFSWNSEIGKVYWCSGIGPKNVRENFLNTKLVLEDQERKITAKMLSSSFLLSKWLCRSRSASAIS